MNVRFDRLAGCGPVALWWAIILSVAGPLSGAEHSRRPFTVDRDVVFKAAGEDELKADIYLPNRDTNPGLRPGVLMIHGGAWMSGSKFNVAIHAMKLAKSGYVVMAIDYRLAPKYKFPAQLEDCESALKWFGENASKYNVDVNRVAAYGYSAGGHLACLMGVRQPSAEPSGAAVPRLSAIVAGGAPCEFREMPESSTFLAYWLGGTRGEMPETYQQASPTAFASKETPPVFFFHGAKDQLVPVRSPKSLQLELERYAVPTEMVLVKDGGHVAAFFDGNAMDAARQFLDKQLKRPTVERKSGTKQSGTAGGQASLPPCQ